MKHLFLLAALASGTAWATDPVPHDGGHAETHGGGHAEAPHGGEHEGDSHGAHHDPGAYYLGDADGDGTPNWMDASWDGETRGTWDILTEADDPFVIPEIGFHTLNLAVLLTLLFVFAARPIGDALKNRALAIRKDLVDAARARDEARQKNEELAARLQRFEKELEQMRAQAAQDAKADAELLVARANAEAERIEATAGRSIAEEVRRAKASLRAEAVDLAVKLAEATLSKEVQSDDQRRLARQFLESLNNNGEAARG